MIGSVIPPRLRKANLGRTAHRHLHRNQLRNGQVDSAESRHRTSEQQHGLAYVEKTPTGIDMPQFNSKSPKKSEKLDVGAGCGGERARLDKLTPGRGHEITRFAAGYTNIGSRPSGMFGGCSLSPLMA